MAHVRVGLAQVLEEECAAAHAVPALAVVKGAGLLDHVRVQPVGAGAVPGAGGAGGSLRAGGGSQVQSLAWVWSWGQSSAAHRPLTDRLASCAHLFGYCGWAQ